jgi:hypothetical protein
MFLNFNFFYYLYNTTLDFINNSSYLEQYYYEVSIVNKTDTDIVQYKVDYLNDNKYKFLKIYLVLVYLFLVLLLFISIIFIFYMYQKMEKYELMYNKILSDYTKLKTQYIKKVNRKRYLK